MRFTVISSSQLGDNWSAEHHINQKEHAMPDEVTPDPGPALVLERQNERPSGVYNGGALMVTPDLNEDYWAYRVKLTNEQAVIGFPKFGIIGIGFAVEREDWNRNLPADTSALELFRWIAVNKGDDSIDEATVIRAIEMIQMAVQADKLERIVQSLKQPSRADEPSQTA
jgi:hypothetical protein